MDATAQSLKQRAALASIFASAALTLGKLVAGLLSGSLALISEAGHSLLDTGATILTYFAVRISGKPADDDHHFGHGKVEAVTALAETGFLMVLAAAVLFEAMRRLFFEKPPVIEAGWLAFGVLGVAIVVDLVRWLSLRKVAMQTGSDALAADALHFSSDLVASVCVLLGLVATKLGFEQGDGVAAIGVAVFIAIAGYRLGRRTINTLVDTAPQDITQRVRSSALAVSGVVGVDSIRLRPAGPQVIGEIAISVPRTLSIEGMVAVKEAVARAIAAETPDAAITITADPVALDDETVLERVLLISARRGLPVHHVTVQEVGGKRSVSLDLELDGRMAHGDAHDVATALEEAIEAELGQGIEVETHIEPLEADALEGQDVSPARAADIEARLVEAARTGGTIEDVHNVRVRETAKGLVVNYHCGVDPKLTVAAVHDAVDRLDHDLRASVGNIVRVVGHAEPIGG